MNEQLYISALTPGHAKLYYVQLNKSLQAPQTTVAVTSAGAAIVNQQQPEVPPRAHHALIMRTRPTLFLMNSVNFL